MANRTYRYFKGEPLYPFGYGLSYTEFAYSKPSVDSHFVAFDGSLTVGVDVTNKGAMDGDEVVQLYLTHEGVAGAALKELRGFQRVHLARGQTKTVTFKLRDRDLSVVDSEGTRRVAQGKVTAWIGGGQPAVAGQKIASAGVGTEFDIYWEKKLPD